MNLTPAAETQARATFGQRDNTLNVNDFVGSFSEWMAVGDGKDEGSNKASFAIQKG